MGNSAARVGPTGADMAAEMLIGEVVEAYPNQWIVLGVTRYNDRDEPEAGVVQNKSRSYRAATRALGSLAASETAEVRLFLFFASPGELPAHMTGDRALRVG